MKTFFIIISFICIITVVVFHILGLFDTISLINKYLIGMLTTVLFWVLIYLIILDEINN